MRGPPTLMRRPPTPNWALLAVALLACVVYCGLVGIMWRLFTQ